MTSHWNWLRTGPGAPSWNMALDEALLEHCSDIGCPILRFYRWNEPAATFGYFQKYSDVASWTPLRPLIRRPTAGGLVPHDFDWTYSLILPREHPWYKTRAEESYRRAHDWISEAFRSIQIDAQLANSTDKQAPGRCFVGAEKFDLLAGGRKIAGAAQKRNKLGLLIQGSIQPPKPAISRERWEESLLRAGTRMFSIHWRTLVLPQAILSRAAELDREKYSTDSYNQRR